MLEIRTDLAQEAHEIASKNKEKRADGVIFETERDGCCTLTRIEIVNKDGEEATGKPIGKYLTADVGRLWDMSGNDTVHAVGVIARMIRELAGDPRSVLVAGLGNLTVTADALGPAALDHVIVTRHLKEESPHIYQTLGFADVSAIAPGVLSQTGVETLDSVRSICNAIKPSLVIAIDALASRNVARLGTAVQITNVGIAPGSGVGNRRCALNESTLGIPVIAIGIPTVVDALTLALNVAEALGISHDEIARADNVEECASMFVTPKDSDKMISHMAKVLGYSVNTAFHRQLSFEEMVSISG